MALSAICSSCGAAKEPHPKIYRCSACQKQYDHERYLANRAKVLERSRIWQAEHSEYRKDYMKRYYEDRKQQFLAGNRARYESNKDSYLAQQAEYYAQNRERICSRVSKYRKNNPDKINALGHAARARKANAEGRFTESEWLAIIARQRGKCASCGKKRKLTKDHIVPLSRGGSNFAFNIQGLCKSCNSSKNAKMVSGAQHSLFDRVA